MASPHVAGVAALIHQGGVHGPAAIRDRLRASATPKDDPARYGAGILNAAAAVGASRVAPPVAVPAPARPRAPLAPWLLLAAALLLVPPVAAPKPAP